MGETRDWSATSGITQIKSEWDQSLLPCLETGSLALQEMEVNIRVSRDNCFYLCVEYVDMFPCFSLETLETVHVYPVSTPNYIYPDKLFSDHFCQVT